MLGGFGDGALEFGFPLRRRLPRTCVDQIERVAVERLPRDGDRVERLLRGVQPAELLQRRIVERLHAERHAVDAGRAIAAKARRLDAGGIGFERDLDVGRDGPVLADGVEDRADGLGLHQRRRAAAEEDARYGAAGTRAAVEAISVWNARRNRGSSIAAWRTWLLKSQYGHFDRQNGQCT